MFSTLMEHKDISPALRNQFDEGSQLVPWKIQRKVMVLAFALFVNKETYAIFFPRIRTQSYIKLL